MNEKFLRAVAKQMILDSDSVAAVMPSVVCTELDSWTSQAGVVISPKWSLVHFRIQDGPIKEKGVNGCQVDDIIKFAQLLVEEFNREFPCPENDSCIGYLAAALERLEDRRKDREKRGVEGRNEV